MTNTSAIRTLDDYSYAELSPTFDWIRRISQIAGKYTPEQPYRLMWLDVPHTPTPDGFRSRPMRSGTALFSVDYDFRANHVSILTPTGPARIPIVDGQSVAEFYRAFLAAATPFGIQPPRSPVEVEFPGCTQFADDTTPRHYDQHVALAISAAYYEAAYALNAWQSNFVGFAGEAGIMWGEQGFYSYLSPSVGDLTDVDFSASGAAWHADAGLVTLPLAVLSPTTLVERVVALGDTMYELARSRADWPDQTIIRCDGRLADQQLITFPTSAIGETKG